MKISKILTILAVLGLSACAGTPVSEFAHKDVQAAAAIATKNGYPERALVWKAIDSKLTADEQIVSAAVAQAKACAEAIKAVKPSTDGVTGPASLAELAAEAVAAGTPAKIKALCEPVPLPSGLTVKGIPLP